jgi:hypothetical protein
VVAVCELQQASRVRCTSEQVRRAVPGCVCHLTGVTRAIASGILLETSHKTALAEHHINSSRIPGGPHLINCALVHWLRGGGGRVRMCQRARGINLVSEKPRLQGKDDPL